MSVFPHRHRPVCYGGGFSALADGVRQLPLSAWEGLRDALVRGDNIEEGHYAERLWAVLLAPRLHPGCHAKLGMHVAKHTKGWKKTAHWPAQRPILLNASADREELAGEMRLLPGGGVSVKLPEQPGKPNMTVLRTLLCRD